MNRLVKTSAGWVVVGLDDIPGSGLSISVTSFDTEGWERRGKSWSEKWGHHEREETLPQFLSRALEIPAVEAEQLASEIEGSWMEGWESRGGREQARSLKRGTWGLMAAVGIALLLSLTAVALIIWLVVS